ncbi:FtsQ-type POTRA domain-containing protein [Streptomyces sp. ISL-10]|uniref:cell division protein FtsQ/DivIB n=1 Tax=Streptomyces sp. ISL-10 TaxID=2819172 RepID=UPI001BE63604|nr:FtsQ-type POTRA domain-containing protein [Streptomyces sp. ISL-10]MBT2366558.1 FtsQ-type POTRA domain-containing protein [Streptomyces sp. ISL-10]
MAGPTTAERGARNPRDGSAGSDGSVRPPRQDDGGGRRRRPGSRVLAVAVAAVLLAAGAIWVLYGSQWLRAEHVRISGTEVLTPQQVQEVAAVPIGAPLIAVDTDAIEARLRQKLPRIDSVDVVRSWPHGIGLEVTERKPVLVLEKSGKFIEVDAKSVRFATVETAPKGVPRLELTTAGSPSAKRFGAGRLVAEAVRVRGDLPARIVRDLTTVDVRSYDRISLELKGGRTVLWGSSEEGEAKARTLTALMKAAPVARHFDVSAPTAPAVSGS